MASENIQFNWPRSRNNRTTRSHINTAAQWPLATCQAICKRSRQWTTLAVKVRLAFQGSRGEMRKKTTLHFLKRIVCPRKWTISKGNSSSKHPFSGAFAVSFREGYSHPQNSKIYKLWSVGLSEFGGFAPSDSFGAKNPKDTQSRRYTRQNHKMDLRQQSIYRVRTPLKKRWTKKQLPIYLRPFCLGHNMPSLQIYNTGPSLRFKRLFDSQTSCLCALLCNCSNALCQPCTPCTHTAICNLPIQLCPRHGWRLPTHHGLGHVFWGQPRSAEPTDVEILVKETRGNFGYHQL